MEKNGGKTDYSRITSRQIAVYKTDKALLELVDSLKPAGASYPAHIHASGEEDEEGYSLIRLQMVDYSAGTGQKSVSVYANIFHVPAEDIWGSKKRRVCQCDKAYGQQV